MRARGFGFESAVSEVELREGVVTWADEAEEIICLRQRIEEGSCADGGEEGRVGGLGGVGGGEEVEVC